MKLTLEQVRHVAALARLSLSPDEENKYVDQLSAILEAVDTLAQLDTSGVEPTSHASLGLTLRVDQTTDIPVTLETGALYFASNGLVGIAVSAGAFSFALPGGVL